MIKLQTNIVTKKNKTILFIHISLDNKVKYRFPLLSTDCFSFSRELTLESWNDQLLWISGNTIKVSWKQNLGENIKLDVFVIELIATQPVIGRKLL